MTSQIPYDIHPLNMLLFSLITVVLVLRFVFLVFSESDDEKRYYDDDFEPDAVEEIYEEVERVREEPDCFGPEAAASLAEFNEETEIEWGGEEPAAPGHGGEEPPAPGLHKAGNPLQEGHGGKEDAEEEEHIEEHLPDILLLVRMPYDRGCDLLKRHNNDDVQFYGWYTKGQTRTRSQSI